MTDDLSRAVTVHRGDAGDLIFDERMLPVGPPGPHDLLVAVGAASVNPVDSKVARDSPDPRVLGFDASGEVLAVGEAVTLFRPGDAVFYAGTLRRPGSHQTLQLVDERIVGHRPAGMTVEDAAAMPLTSITAWEALFDKLKLSADAAGTLLMMGAAGGVGSVLVQLVHALLPGVRVIATASRESSRAWLADLGVDTVVDHAGDLVGQVRALAPGGVDWIVSPHSQGRIPDYAAMLRPFGEIVGLDRGPIEVTALKPLSASWHWEFMFTRADPSGPTDLAHHRILESVAALAAEGRLRTPRTETVDDATPATLAAAYQRVAAAGVAGKLVIRMR
ncbi:zinc-binding dehydrogenase [Microbacterium aureliae]